MDDQLITDIDYSDMIVSFQVPERVTSAGHREINNLPFSNLILCGIELKVGHILKCFCVLQLFLSLEKSKSNLNACFQNAVMNYKFM